MSEELGQALVDELRQYGLARLVTPFAVGESGVSIGRTALYRAVPHQDGRDPAGNALEGVYFEAEETPQIEAAVNAHVVVLLEERFRGKRAGGVLKVDEEGRLWADELVEADLAPAGDGTAVRYDL